MQQDKVKYWVELADYDFETAQAMFETKRFLYVGFSVIRSLKRCSKPIGAMFWKSLH